MRTAEYTNYRIALHNLFSAQIRNRIYIPGREGYDEIKEKERERAEYEVIDDYVEQA